MILMFLYDSTKRTLRGLIDLLIRLIWLSLKQSVEERAVAYFTTFYIPYIILDSS